ncbi:hypothetical protein, partial [Streptomyces galilaeus]|uniref:hypothetical protein n=1 Tax=Streptomyces galilaeus TaxID=33899 RepID=UPI001E5D8013
ASSALESKPRSGSGGDEGSDPLDPLRDDLGLGAVHAGERADAFGEVALADNVIRAGWSQCVTVRGMPAASPTSTTLARLAITQA